jgi:hypothetical protein
MSPLAKLILPIAFFVHSTGVSPAAEEPKKNESRPTGTLQVRVADGYLWLNADNAALAQVFREIARQSGIAIENNIGPEEKITTRLDRVPLEDGIRQIAKNVSFTYAQDANAKTRRISRVVVLTEAKRPATQIKTPPQFEKVNETASKPVKQDKPSQPEPFKFQFDPKKAAEQKSGEK